ncbi:MAG: MBL fold metallo-hydrolase [Propionibacteriaceae bacterium]|jgi:glyoxylase-like metal-dependent hydrolase (beta-lactamase superfamily II)|nr:MBL fold metallo-hydrolase [Propionibacteriaceae bacterium]
MFLRAIECGPLQANCYILAPSDNSDCLIIDPGMEAADAVQALVTKQGLTPRAILATHGHFDHVADFAHLADHYDVPAWIHSADQPLLRDPAGGVDPGLGALLRSLLPDGLPAPKVLSWVDDQTELHLAGLDIAIIPAPGHTLGCVFYQVRDADTGTDLTFTGDVLFAGSIGRTDTPFADHAAMVRTLKGPVLSLPDSAQILPGHGPASTMAIERRTNPFLQPSFLR